MVAEETFAYESTDTPFDPVSSERPNVLLITLDTVRADRLGPYGYERAHTPHLNALAEEAVLFEHCCASVPVTLPSHATIITGLEPYEHGVRNNGIHAIAPDITTLAERRAARVSELGADWIHRHRRSPWFAWLHHFDPHDPYDPPAPYDRMCADPYDGEIAYTDAHLGGLFRELHRQGLWDATLIIVTADHGEETHSLFVYHTTIHVPLLIKPAATGAWRDQDLGGRRCRDLVATTDIYPTILDLAGLSDAAAESAGPGGEAPRSLAHSLGPVLDGHAHARSWAYLESLVPEFDYGWSPYRAVIHDGWKYIDAPRPELYDLTRDPGERRNLIVTDAPDAAHADAAHAKRAEGGAGRCEGHEVGARSL